MSVTKGFKLEKVLRYRREMERTRTLEFAVARQLLEEASEGLRREEAAAERVSEELTNRQQEGINAEELRIYADFFQRKRTDIQQRRQDVDELNGSVAVKRDSLMEAAREKKALEALKEKTALARRRELAGQEQLFLEELALRKR